MKSLLLTLTVFMLLAHLVSGGWYARKCAHKTGICRKRCRDGEITTQPVSGMCPMKKSCCVLGSKDQSVYPSICAEGPTPTNMPAKGATGGATGGATRGETTPASSQAKMTGGNTNTVATTA
nr:beta-defensin 126 [Dasypus novemcinctus]